MNGAASKNRYEIIQEIGRGGMGSVYKAYDNKLQRFIALKVLASHYNLKRFAAEYTAMAKLNHPNIVRLFECGDSPQPFLAMEYIEGQTLTRYSQKLNRTDLIDLFIKICEALAYAHSRKIIHRDIKPSNIMVDKNGQPKVMDFGLVKFTEGESISASGEILGTPTYMSPEQVNGKCTPKSDIYSIGATLYEILTGQKMYSGTVQNIIVQVLHKNPVPPRQISSEICPYLEAICLKCISRNPRRRYKNFKQLVQELKNLQNNKPILAKKYTSWDTAKKLFIQHKVIFASIFIVFVVLVGSVLILMDALADKAKANEELQANIKIKEEFLESTVQFYRLVQKSKYADLFFEEELVKPLVTTLSKPENLPLIEKYELFGPILFDSSTQKDTLELALQYYNNFIAKNPNKAVTYNNRGNIFFKLNQYDKALEDYNKAISLNDTYFEAYNNRGNMYFHLERYQEALVDYNTAEKMRPNDPKLCYNFGKVYIVQKKFDIAKKYLSKVLASNPSDAPSYCWRGFIHHKQRKFRLALVDYNKAIALENSYATAFFYRGELYISLGNFDLAQKDFSSAIAIYPNYVEAYSSRGSVLYMQGKHKLAENDLNKALQLDNKSKNAYHYRGLVYAAQNKLRLALQDWENAIHYGVPRSQLQSEIDKVRKMLK
ncbi:protein kinase domain-containing protein [Candidatus Uabimicrobium amorphum]|uniref:Protein kinase n=1 Tax=Uabimicrobium amorphum TaxID=2596890 RepID=A0A5S9IM48_UABAM|nr:tetratricopeptide repeat protein [Candidatus Uabimicrobium amorphum]BBM84409.1 protein kinase [Candidatus Uabimicrobium amorphum]